MEKKASENKGVSAPSISLPKGGGAIRGIGEKFAANPVTGTGSMTVPIATSPGRSGFGPQLSLSYDSGAGNGPFGLGWSLNLPAITRKTDKGLPQYLDAVESDVFILSGAEDLVPVYRQDPDGFWVRDKKGRLVIHEDEIDGYLVRRYRPRIEGLFARIERWTKVDDPGEVHWRSISKDNILTLYGSDRNSRIFDPETPGRIFSWLISETRDDKGNGVLYRYKAEDGEGVTLSKANERNRGDTNDKRRTANRYIKHIYYGNRTSLLDENGHRPRFLDKAQIDKQIEGTGWMFEVVFDYEEHGLDVPKPNDTGTWKYRGDPFSSYRAGFEVRTTRLCQRVLMFHHFPDEAGVGKDCLVRSTDFTYDYENGTESSPKPLYSYLKSVTQTGYRRNNGGYYKRSLPPVEFEYSQPIVQDTVHDVDPESMENLPIGVEGTAYQWTDLHGEGIPGILSEQTGAWFYKRNLSPIGKKPVEFAPLEYVAAKPNLNMAGGAQFMDLAGDGQPDLVVLDGPMPGLYEHDTEEGWQPFRPFIARLNRNMRDPNLKFVDLDGDGHADVLITEDDAFVWHPSLAEEGFAKARRVVQALDEEKGPRLVFADGTQSIYLADLSGDGLTDLVRIRNGEVCYWPNLGYGKFGAKVTMDNAPCFDNPDQFDQKRVRLADIDGSGTTDIIYLHRNGVRLYFNQSGNSWSKAQLLNVFPRTDDVISIVPTDLLGNGTACLVWSSPLPGDARRPMRYVNLMGEHKPHLLIKTVNNLGAETHVHYAPSTKFYLADKRDGKPWVTRLPFPVHVVERVETCDRISRNRFVTRYAYHHGHFDGVEREFRGFGMVAQWDTEQFETFATSVACPDAANADNASHVPPVHTKTWFHTGAFYNGKEISKHFEKEYYREGDTSLGESGLSDEQLDAMLLEDTILPDSRSPEGAREASRALKGSILRVEVYALDNKEASDRPYNVSERSYQVREIQPRGENRHGVFLVQPRETIDFHYERKLYDISGELRADPRVTHTLTLEVDEYGNVVKSATVGYGRRFRDTDLTDEDHEKQGQTLLTYTDNSYTNAILEADNYRTPISCESRTYELVNVKPEPDRTLPGITNLFWFEKLVGKISSAADGSHDLDYEDVNHVRAVSENPYRRLIEHVRMLYRKDDLTAMLPLCEVEPLALSGETYKLAFTPGLLAQVYQRNGQPLIPNMDDVLSGQESDRGGYVHSENDANWWIPSGRIFYHTDANIYDTAATAAQELAEAQQHFFLPRKFSDPFGNCTTVNYDAPHDLLLTRTQDAVGNVIQAMNDYRVLQPRELIDPNENHTEAAFDALGMLVGTAVKGKVEDNDSTESGDSLEDFNADLTQQELDDFFAAPKSEAAKLLAKATTRIIYDVNCYFLKSDPNLPTYAVTLAREKHVVEEETSPIQVSFSFSDGFGREILKKIQAEPGKVEVEDEAGNITIVDTTPEIRWVGSGWTIFNNKGKPVRQYEPFFSVNHQFQFGKKVGVSPVLFYDPVGRVVATLHPNHTYEKVVFDPWLQKTYDVNDTAVASDNETGDPRTDEDIKGYVAEYFKTQPDSWKTWYQMRITGGKGEQEQIAAEKTAKHANTPTVAHIDTLGRTFLTIADNGRDENGEEQKYETRITLDIEGNQREVIDAKGRVVMRYDYHIAGPEEGKEDEAGHRIHQDSMDAGERWMLNDVTGKPIRSWDSRGHEFRYKYDGLRRPIEMKVIGGDRPESLDHVYEKIIYGEDRSFNGNSDNELNLRGKIFQHYDTAGLVTNEEYDFKGNLKKSSRRLIKAYKESPDWSVADPESLLESEPLTTETAYDALNRPVTVITPDQSITTYVYNEANFINQVEVQLRGKTESTPFVNNIDYNEKGQRTKIEYGNDVMTEYAYDRETFRLIHLFTTKTSGERLQDLYYTFDPIGNITYIRDDAQKSIIYDNQIVEPHCSYIYDPIYHLIEATGREHIGQASNNLPQHMPELKPHYDFNDSTRINPNDANAMRNYTERYTYDQVGNIMRMHHSANSGTWSRGYSYADDSNRLLSTQLPGDPDEGPYKGKYDYDAHGSMVRMPHLPIMEWDFKDQLRSTQRQVVSEDCQGEKTYYVYDSAGERVRKVTQCQARPGEIPQKKNERIYLGGFEIYREYSGTDIKLERETLHVTDDKKRIALVETKTIDTSSPLTPYSSLTRYQFDNHLGSTVFELGQDKKVISYEEYYPYGSTSYQAVRSDIEVSSKQYRYTGKERDEESGLYYHGARYYAPWLGRWASYDPIGLIGGINLYRYAANNPIKLVDLNGTQPVDPENKGLQAARALAARLRAKGHGIQLEVTIRGGKGGSRVDIAPDPRASQTVARTLESKYMDISRYRTEAQLLDVQKIRSAIREDIQQVLKHEAALRRGIKPDLPFRESIVYQLENATPQEISVFRRMFRAEARRVGIKGGAMSFSPAPQLSTPAQPSPTPAAPVVSSPPLTAPKMIPKTAPTHAPQPPRLVELDPAPKGVKGTMNAVAVGLLIQAVIGAVEKFFERREQRRQMIEFVYAYNRLQSMPHDWRIEPAR